LPQSKVEETRYAPTAHWTSADLSEAPLAKRYTFSYFFHLVKACAKRGSF